MAEGKMMSKLDKVVAMKIAMGVVDRYAALEEISDQIERDGSWATAKTFQVLDDNESAEDFMIEFMTAFNNEVYRYF